MISVYEFPNQVEKVYLYSHADVIYTIVKEVEMENYNKRWIGILYYFLEHKDYVNGDNIALSVGVSSRTIRNDIKELNELLKQHDAEILSEIGVGYCLKINDQTKFHHLLEELKAAERFLPLKNIVPSNADERIWYITSQLLIHSLKQGDVLDGDSLADQLFISDATLRKDLQIIGTILKEYELKISNTKKYGLRIVGEEAKIRFCISQYVFNAKSNVIQDTQMFYEDIFDHQDIETVKTVLTTAIIKYDLKLTDMAFKNLVIHTLIMLKRSKEKQHVIYKNEDIEMLQQSKEYRCSKEIMEGIQATFHIPFVNEVFYLTQHLVASQKFLIEHTNDDYTFKDVVLKILHEIKETMHIDLSEDLQLINGLAIHLHAAMQRVHFDMNIRNEFLDVLKNTYPLAFELATIACRIIENEYLLMLKEAEIGFLTIHFGASLERNGLQAETKDRQEKPRIKVALVCIAGVAMALLLKEKLLRRFGDYIEIVKTSPAQQVDEALMRDVDIILTTVDLPQIHKENILKISLFPKEEDFKEIAEILQEEHAEHHDIQYKDIFKEELFFTNMTCNSKQEIIEYMTNAMMQKGYIDETVKKSILKREAISTTEMGGLIAIPHAMLNDIETFAVSVMVLNKPILWEKLKVQVVFLLNIPKKDYQVWESVFKTLYRNLIANGGVNKLIKHQNYEQFIIEMQTHDTKDMSWMDREGV